MIRNLISLQTLFCTHVLDRREDEDKIKDVERKLYELDYTRSDLERQVSDSTKAVNDRLYIAKTCRDARSAVQEGFKDANHAPRTTLSVKLIDPSTANTTESRSQRPWLRSERAGFEFDPLAIVVPAATTM